MSTATRRSFFGAITAMLAFVPAWAREDAKASPLGLRSDNHTYSEPLILVPSDGTDVAAVRGGVREDVVFVGRQEFEYLWDRSRGVAPYEPTITGLQFVDKAVILEDEIVSGFWEGEMLGKHILGAAVLTYYPGWDKPMVSRIEDFSGSTQAFWQDEMDRMWVHWPASERWDLARTHGGRYAVRVYYTTIVPAVD